MSELRPCPFCGGTELVFNICDPEQAEDFAFVECKCGVCVWRFDQDEGAVIETWNRRPDVR